MNFEEYKLIKNSIQLVDVDLVSLECKKLDGNSRKLGFKLERAVNKLESRKVEIFLRVTINFEEEPPFYLTLEYKGICNSKDDNIVEDSLIEYADTQVVPLLLPYARECISNTLLRMKLPVFNLPTMDILRSMTENED